jgi:hypothetical protein
MSAWRKPHQSCNTWSMTKTIALVVISFCLVGIATGFLFGYSKSGTDVPLELAKGLISLEGLIIITGGLSFILSERTRKQDEQAEKDREAQAEQAEKDREAQAEQAEKDREARAERAEKEKLLISVRQDLKSANEKVQLAKSRLRADPSPMRLREQIEVLIEVRAQLQDLRYEQVIKNDDCGYEPIKKMADYLGALGKEYATNLREITRECLAFERDMRRYLRGETDDSPSAPPLNLNMETYSLLKVFLDKGEGEGEDPFDKTDFRMGYKQARSWIEERLSSLLVG